MRLKPCSLLKLTAIILALIMLASSLGYIQPTEAGEPAEASKGWRRVWYEYLGNGEFGKQLGVGPHEPHLNFDNNWGDGTVAYDRSDMIGFKSTTIIIVKKPGTYRFTVGSDDGVRLYVDKELVIDAWKDQPYTLYQAQVRLSKGEHRLELDWYENHWAAHVSFRMEKVPEPSYPADKWERLWYEYLGNGAFGKFLGFGPDQSEINFDDDWGDGRIAYDRSDRIGFISSRTIKTEEGVYEITVGSDDGVRLYVDDKLLIDQWHDQAYTKHTVKQKLIEGPHRFRLEWYENGWAAHISFRMEKVPEPSYPDDKWERLWYEYDGNGNLGEFLGSGPHQPHLDFDDNWGDGEVAHGHSDRIGFISSRTIEVKPGTYKFIVGSDDGVCLWVDGHKVIDEWHDQGYTEYQVEMDLDGGKHRLRLEWYENAGGAHVSFRMEKVQEPSYPSDRWERLWYEYMGNGNFGNFLGSGPDQPKINFDDDWGDGVVAHGKSDMIGFVSSRTIEIKESGTYRFTVGSDDGVRLYVDDELLIDEWHDQGYTQYQAEKFLEAGNHRLRLEWYENGWAAHISFQMEKI